MARISGSNAHRARVHNYACSGAVVVLDGERSPDILNADSSGLHSERMRGIVHYAEVGHSIQRHCALPVPISGSEYQSTSRTKKNFGPILKRNLATLTERCSKRFADGIHARPVDTLPKQCSPEYDDSRGRDS